MIGKKIDKRSATMREAQYISLELIKRHVDNTTIPLFSLKHFESNQNLVKHNQMEENFQHLEPVKQIK